MSRNQLIAIAVALFVLAGCAGVVVIGVVVWPSRSGPEVDPPLDPPVRVMPEIDGTVPRYDPSYTPPERYTPQQPAGSAQGLSEADLLPGVWQCVQGNARRVVGSAMQFLGPVGATGTVYMSENPQSGGDWIEASYELGTQGYLVISPVAYLYTPVSSHYAIQFPDVNTMVMYSLEEGDQGMTPAVLVRVQ